MKNNHTIFVTSIDDIPDIKEKFILTKCINCKLSICWHKLNCNRGRCRFCHCYYIHPKLNKKQINENYEMCINKNFEMCINELFLYYYEYFLKNKII